MTSIHLWSIMLDENDDLWEDESSDIPEIDEEDIDEIYVITNHNCRKLTRDWRMLNGD